MGNDGGSFAHRSEMVKMKKHKQKTEKTQQAKIKTNLCQLSKEPLQAPSENNKSNICICMLGNIYNKEEVLKKLIDK